MTAEDRTKRRDEWTARKQMCGAVAALLQVAGQACELSAQLDSAASDEAARRIIGEAFARLCSGAEGGAK
jgi:hypothetical protein